MKKATQQDKDKLLHYLEPYMVKCLYLYLDISLYNLEDVNGIEVWYEEDEKGFSFIVMKYFNSLQIFDAIRNNMDGWEKPGRGNN